MSMEHTNQTFRFAGEREIRRVGYGAMRLTGQPGNYGPYEDWAAGIALLRRAVDLGIQHIDTARAYGPGWNEELIAEALSPYPDDLLIATKGGIDKSGPGGQHITRDGRPQALRQHIEASLGRLKADRIDLYYLHAPDPTVPFEDSIGELERARASGEIAHIGVSNVTLEQLERGLAVAPIRAVQNRYDPVHGGDEAVLEFATAHDIAFVPWGPLGTNPFDRVAPLAQGDVEQSDGLTPAQRALIALLTKAPNMVPIPGTTSSAHLEENVRALGSLGTVSRA